MHAIRASDDYMVRGEGDGLMSFPLLSSGFLKILLILPFMLFIVLKYIMWNLRKHRYLLYSNLHLFAVKMILNENMSSFTYTHNSKIYFLISRFFIIQPPLPPSPHLYIRYNRHWFEFTPRSRVRTTVIRKQYISGFVFSSHAARPSKSTPTSIVRFFPSDRDP